jgi:RNA polymerase sigma factor (sigma-70 family)
MPRAVASAQPASAVPRDDEARLAETVERERRRLQTFIRRRVADFDEADDILQDVFYELVRAERLMEPIEQVGAWLSRVARNRIIDRFRTRKPQRSTADIVAVGEDGEMLLVEDLLPSPEAGPEAAYAHAILVDELEAALEELPVEQREVFVAHEVDGRSFKELARETGLSVNTLLGRKHHAVRRLRKRLQAIHDEFKGDTI